MRNGLFILLLPLLSLGWPRLLHGAVPTAGAWMVRDVAANSPWTSADASQSSLHLKLATARDGDISHCTVLDTSGNDRAVTLAYCLPLDAVGGTWWDDPQQQRTIEPHQVFSNCSDRAAGAGGQASLYPLAVVTPAAGDHAIALAVPPDPPRMVRFVYDAAARQLRAEFDLGISHTPREFPSCADATVLALDVPARWAFRQAIQAYWDRYPQAFVRRVKNAGTWLPFAETGPIKDARDFGFAFHEIAAEQAIGRILDDDARIGCGSYVYVEPQTYWQRYTGPGKGTYAERRAQLLAEAANGSPIARSTIVSGILRGDGKRDLYLDPVAYTMQLPWGSNPDPRITDPDSARHWMSKGAYENQRLEKLLGWNLHPASGGANPLTTAASTRPGTTGPTGVDGVYVDSMEGWGELLDFDRHHWQVTSFPLTFDPATKKVAMLDFWGTVAWVKQMSQQLHAHGMPLFGNDAFYRRWQMAAYVDVPGREYTWVDKDGHLTPVEDARYLFLRAMSGHKPYLMLMNNRFEDGSIMEPYLQRSVFYAVYPSAFQGHQAMNEVQYFTNPAWYNRDRGLFKKYIPMIRRLDQAGWAPVPFATAAPADARIERYGNFPGGTLAFTIHNPAPQARAITLTLRRADLAISAAPRITEWFSGNRVVPHIAGDRLQMTVPLPPQGYAVVGIAPAH